MTANWIKGGICIYAQEQINKDQINMVVKLGKGAFEFTGKNLLKILKALKNSNENRPQQRTLKNLGKDNSKIEFVKVNNPNIENFKNSARRFGVNFTLQKDRVTGENYLFFKAKDKDVVFEAVKDFYAMDKKGRQSPFAKEGERAKGSILKRIKELKDQSKELLKNAPINEHKKNRGEAIL